MLNWQHLLPVGLMREQTMNTSVVNWNDNKGVKRHAISDLGNSDAVA